jgi:hypothetical protein
MKLFIDANQVRVVRDKGDVITIPASAVTEISYGQDVHSRVGAAIGLAVISLGIGALMALTKSKKRYVGMTWADGDKKGGFAMQCDRSDYRGVLTGLGPAYTSTPLGEMAIVECAGRFVRNDAAFKLVLLLRHRPMLVL